MLTRKSAKTTERGYFMSGGEFRFSVAPWPAHVEEILNALGLDGRGSTWHAVFRAIALRIDLHDGYAIEVDECGDEAWVRSTSTQILDRFCDELDEALADKDRTELLLRSAAALLDS